MASPALGQSLNTVRYIAEIPYYIANAKTHPGLENDDVTGPCTVIPYDDSPTTDYVRDFIATFTSDDDVWSSAFLDTVVFAGSPRNAQPAEDIVDFLSQRGIFSSDFDYSKSPFVVGPILVRKYCPPQSFPPLL